ncbi:MAG: hypothetical protein RLZZ09_2597, partial [Pseudomonadota bacterium]
MMNLKPLQTLLLAAGLVAAG